MSGEIYKILHSYNRDFSGARLNQLSHHASKSNYRIVAYSNLLLNITSKKIHSCIIY